MESAKTLSAACLATVLAFGASAGENLFVFETDFEAGTDGWFVQNPAAVAPGRARDAAVGKWSMEYRGASPIRSAAVWDVLKPETDYVLSFLVKGDAGELKVSVITENWHWLGVTAQRLGPDWSACRLPFRTGKKVPGRSFYVNFAHEKSSTGGWARIDAVKLEEGKAATDYVPPSIQFAAALEDPGEIHLEEDGVPAMKVRLAGSGVAALGRPLTAETVDAEGRTVAAAELDADGAATVGLPSAAGSGYYPFRTRVRDGRGTVVAVRETPFVVTHKAPGNGFFGTHFAPGVEAAALRRVGFEWTRSNTKWWMWEEPDGPRTYTGREPVAARRPDAFRLLGTAWGNAAPKWALGKGRRQWTDDVRRAIPYLENLVRTTTNVVDQYEIINEPDLMLPQEKGVGFEEACDYYCDIVKTSAEVIHRAGKPVVIDVSGCDEGNRLIARVLEKTPESVDIVAIHPYSWPRELSEDDRAVADPETGGFLDDLCRKREIVARHPGKRMVIGELGWSLDMSAPYASRSVAKYGWYLARMYLLARSFPEMEYLMWFSLASTPENGRFDYCLWRCSPADGSRPLAQVAAACEAARQIPPPGEGAVEALESDGVYFLKWRRDGAVRYAYWTDEGLDGPLPAPAAAVSARDFTGRVLDPARLTLSEAPVYLELKSGDEKAFETSFRDALYAAYAKRPALVREEVTVKRLSPGDWRTYDFLSDPSLFALGTKRTDVAPPDPTVQWSGADDLSAKALFGWDDANLYFFAAVTDDTHCTPHAGGKMYMNDVIQIAFDPKDNAKKNAAYMQDDCEFGLCAGERLWCWRRPGAEPGYVDGDCAQAVRRGVVTEYRLALPWSALGLAKAPKALGCAFAVPDNDDNARARYWLAFGHGIVDGKRPARFKRLVLSEER